MTGEPVGCFEWASEYELMFDERGPRGPVAVGQEGETGGR